FAFFDPENGNGLFFRNSRVRIQDITDGTSNTLAIGERAALFVQAPWAGVWSAGSARTTPDAPVYVTWVHPSPVMVMARAGWRPLHDPYSEPFDFFSPHTGVVQFLFADGAVHAIRITVDVGVYQGLATRNGGETIDASDAW